MDNFGRAKGDVASSAIELKLIDDSPNYYEKMQLLDLLISIR